MMRYLPFCLLLASLSSLFAQSLPSFDPDSLLLPDGPRPQVLLVGSFHMAYPNLDAHVTDAANRADVLSPARQAEMQELVDYLARFRPTRIVIERWPGSSINARYRQYLAGEYELQRDEEQQIGFRLAERFGLDSLVPGDAGSLVSEFRDDSTLACLHPTLDSIYADWDYRSSDPISQRYTALYEHDDRLLREVSLLDYFTYLNSPKRIRRGHGAYLVGDFTLGDHRGADALALDWYARNLRIYRNIQRAVTSPDERILVIFGAGHLGILHQQFASSPEFELVEFGTL